MKAFLAGLQEIIQLDWLKMFNQDELQILISGSKRFDVNDLKNHWILKGSLLMITLLISNGKLWKALHLKKNNCSCSLQQVVQDLHY